MTLMINGEKVSGRSQKHLKRQSALIDTFGHVRQQSDRSELISSNPAGFVPATFLKLE